MRAKHLVSVLFFPSQRTDAAPWETWAGRSPHRSHFRTGATPGRPEIPSQSRPSSSSVRLPRRCQHLTPFLFLRSPVVYQPEKLIERDAPGYDSTDAAGR